MPSYYDSLIAKLIGHDRSRALGLSRVRRALAEYVIAGLPTSIPLLHAIIRDQAFGEGDYHIDWLTGFLRSWQDAA